MSVELPEQKCLSLQAEVEAGFVKAALSAAAHRITELQNGRGWKGPLWVF